MRILIIGAGPAGLMTAVECSKNPENEIIIVDGNEKPGKKLYITGKGRCNVTNNVDNNEFLNNVVTNNKFLYAAINSFSTSDTIKFFEENGTKLKIERGNRVFPLSDKASDITKTFLKVLNKQNVKFIFNNPVLNIKKQGDLFEVKTKKWNQIFESVVVATGGKSYSSTGSTGDGYNFAKSFGHQIKQIKPALVPINLINYNGELAGLSLKNVSVSIKVENKTFSQFGEMLFTHKGVSGPIILTLSSLINKFSISNLILSIDLKPALTEEKLDERLLRDIKEFKNKSLKNYLKELLPKSLVDYFVKKYSIPAEIQMCEINKENRKNIIKHLKNFNFKIDRFENIEYAIVTSGGVDVKEVNPKTMESKLIPGLFFVGEVLDVDAFTGGFNIQIALSTGFCAGNCLKNK